MNRNTKQLLWCALWAAITTIVIGIVRPPVSHMCIGYTVGILLSAYLVRGKNKYEIAAEDIERLRQLAIKYNTPIFTLQQIPKWPDGEIIHEGDEECNYK